jgi:hypothetical protein
MKNGKRVNDRTWSKTEMVVAGMRLSKDGGTDGEDKAAEGDHVDGAGTGAGLWDAGAGGWAAGAAGGARARRARARGARGAGSRAAGRGATASGSGNGSVAAAGRSDDGSDAGSARSNGSSSGDNYGARGLRNGDAWDNRSRWRNGGDRRSWSGNHRGHGDGSGRRSLDLAIGDLGDGLDRVLRHSGNGAGEEGDRGSGETHLDYGCGRVVGIRDTGRVEADGR